MRIYKFTKFVLIIACIIWCNTRVYAQGVPEGYRVASGYLENFSDDEGASLPKIIPPGWDRMEEEKGYVSYSKTRENGGHKGCAIGQTSSQSDIRKGNDLVDYYDYIITPQVKGQIKFWVARYSTSTTPQVEVYRMTKTNNGFVCNPKTDLIFSVSDESWPGYNNSNPKGWVEQEFNVSDYEYLGFRISRAYIDEFEASYAIIPGTGGSTHNLEVDSDNATKSSANSGGNGNLGTNGTVPGYTGYTSKTNNSASQSDDRGQSSVETPSVVTPYFTSNTLFMVTDPSSNRFSQVTDSVFAIRSDGKYEFWTVTGEKLYDAIWRMPKDYSSETPQFDGGVVAMRMAEPNAAAQRPICLLYLDGSVKELDPSWKYVSKFEDGLALAEDGQQDWFYINPAGDKVYPNLMVYSPTDNQVRPMCDGLRAFYGRTEKYGDNLWGFIDGEGKVVIPPKYTEVTDFSDGYAWGVTNNWKEGLYAKELIDVTGKVVYKLAKYTTKTSDVIDGVFKEAELERDVYRNTSGNELASFREATQFCDGYAFVQTRSLGGNVSVIDSDFKIIRELPNDDLPPSSLKNINFAPFGLSTIERSKVIAPNGDLVLKDFGTGFENTIGYFGQFSKAGYATAEGYINSERCFFYIKPTGEIAWMFSDSPKAGGPWEGGRPSPEPWDSLPKGDDPPRITPLPPLPPKGPTRVDHIMYNITVVATPAEGGTAYISPSGPFKYNETATLTAVPNEKWAVASVECSSRGNTNVEIGNPFKVTSNMVIIVHFSKKEDETGPEHIGCYLGTKIPPKDNEFYGKKEWEIPVYAEIGAEGSVENPYGNDNYGFLVLMYDPSANYVSTKGDLSCNFFAVPLKISGFQTDDEERTWMVVDGGSVTAANISAGGDAVSKTMFGLMLGSSGMSSVTTKPRHYRIEMLDIDSITGEFTFGKLQTYSSINGGWVGGGDKKLANKKSGVFATHSESGYPADTFEGIRMKMSRKRNDVLWYPPQNWFENKTIFEKTIESMRSGYKSAKSDYEQLFGE